MLKRKCLLLWFLAYFVLELKAGDVSFINLCKPDDAACLTASAQAAVPFLADGVPDLGIQPADPLHVDHIGYKDANLEINFKNSDITGPRNCKILSLEHNTAEKVFKIALETPLKLTGQYNLHGKILFIEALGDGDYEIQSDRMAFTIFFKYKVVEKNGHKHWKCTKVDYTYDLVEKVHLKFNNLFGGDKAAAEPLMQLLDNGWKEVVTSLGAPIMDKTIAEYSKIVDQLFKNLAVDEIEH